MRELLKSAMPTHDEDDNFGRRLIAFAVALLLVVAIGCHDNGPVRQAVRGHVVVGTDDAVNGSIMFFPAAGLSGPASSASVNEGAYAFDSAAGPLPGEYRVVLVLDADRGESLVAPDAAPIAGKADLIAASETIVPPSGASKLSQKYKSFVTVSSDSEQVLDVKFAVK